MQQNQKIGLGDIVFLTVVLALVVGTPLIVVKNHFLTATIEDYSNIAKYIGYTVLTILTLIVITNINLSFIRPWRYKQKHGSFENYQNISGIPCIGSIFVLAAALLLPPNIFFGILLLALFLMDPGALHFALNAILSDLINARKDN